MNLWNWLFAFLVVIAIISYFSLRQIKSLEAETRPMPRSKDPRTKQEAVEDLIRINFPFIGDYNTANPPPSALAEAQTLAEQRQSYRTNCFITLGVAVFLAIVSMAGSFPGIFWLCDLALFTASYVFWTKAQAIFPQTIERLQNPLPLKMYTASNYYTCRGVKVSVMITVETSYNIPPTPYATDDPLAHAINTKLHLITVKLFDDYEAGEIDLREVSVSQQKDLLEALYLPRICEICHDFQIKVFRYSVTVDFPQEPSVPGVMLLGKDWKPE